MGNTQQCLVTVRALLTTGTHERGRPSEYRASQIEKSLQEYYIKGFSVKFTSERTGHNEKTVSKYYKKFTNEIQDSQSQDFIQRCKEQNLQYSITLETLIDSLYQDMKNIEQYVQTAIQLEDIRQAQNWYKIKHKIIEQIANLVTARTNLINTPTADTTAKILQRGDKDETQSNKMEATT